jgi:uncharacterized membrane protein
MNLHLPASRIRRLALVGIAAVFVAAGANHFLNADVYRPMMPSYLPAHDLLIALSGALEIVGGLAVLLPRWRIAAGWFLITLLVAVFPANLHMALHPEAWPDLPQLGLYARLPLQGVLIFWAWWATRPETRDQHEPTSGRQ